MMQEEKRQELLTTLEILKLKNEVVEVRILKTSQGTTSGYFDDWDKLVQCIEPYYGKNVIYITLNTVKSDLLARSKNRLTPYSKQTTSDQEIERIDYILIDLDPNRTSGTSATKAEKKEALELLKRMRTELIELGFPKPILADSGNGYHMLLPAELQNTPENVQRIKDFLAALDFVYTNDKVAVDRTTYNPSRITKFYGTTACKGENTKDRPHRDSKLINVPDTLGLVSIEQLQLIISKVPKENAASGKKSKANKDFDMEKFIEEHSLELAYKAPFHNKGTKYVLNTCPWNSDHTNKSAFLIHFEDGGIDAGCLHNSCQSENWQTLKELLGIADKIAGSVAGDGDEKQADLIIGLASSCQFFRNELEETFAATNINGHWEVMAINSQRFKLYLTKLFFEKKYSAPGTDALNQAIKVLEMKALFSDTEHVLQKRITMVEDTYYYDLCDEDWRVIKYCASGCAIDANPPILFTRTKNMKKQVEPDISTEPQELQVLVKRHFRFKKTSDIVLLSVYLVSCFLPQIAHVILVLYGEKGAAKSTTMRMVKRIVDPAMQELLSMPTSKQDLAIVLSNNYMPCFDNLDTLSSEKSDMLCMAATGGAFTKRTLYSDTDETILMLKRCLGLNGINIVATRADLLDRSIVVELERIPKDERKTEKLIWKDFEKDVPRFLGAIFNTISQAISLYDTVELEEVGRMADFTQWGFAIAEVIGFGGGQFLEAYLSNQDTANEEALASHPVAAAVIALMKVTTEWSGSVSALLKKLESLAESERINTRVKTWPMDANILSKRLKEVKSNLEETGISYDIRHAGGYKKITLKNRFPRPQEAADTKPYHLFNDDDEDC